MILIDPCVASPSATPPCDSSLGLHSVLLRAKLDSPLISPFQQQVGSDYEEITFVVRLTHIFAITKQLEIGQPGYQKYYQSDLTIQTRLTIIRI